jgi:hypothetical protein
MGKASYEPNHGIKWRRQVMSGIFGFSTQPSAGGDFLGIVKYDSRSGRIFRVDRVDTGGQFVSEPVDITRNFKAIFDLENIETGWINFASGGAPDFKLVPMGSLLPGRPSDQHKNGIRLMLKLAKECGGDKPIREIAGTSKAFLSGVEKLYHDYTAGKTGENVDKLPVVVLKDANPITTGQGAKMSTNYVPEFEIVGWALRGDLVFEPKGGAQVKPKPANIPPATGSSRVAPPVAAGADADFG